jgi:carboxyl-terminal processing protease
MPRTAFMLLRRALLLAHVASFVLLSAAAQGQIRIVEAPTADRAALDDILRQGSELESGDRWGDAMSHYEEALRKYPGDPALGQKYEAARVQYDLTRRYNDASFRRAVGTLSERDALQLYADVLLKIDTHYVTTPNWLRLVQRGTAGLEAALAKPAFIERNALNRSPQETGAFCRELHQWVAAREIRTRHDARDAVAYAARLAHARLGLPPTAVILEYTSIAVGSLDTYSSFLTGDQLRDVFAQIEGNFVGLGIEIKVIDGKLMIVNVIPESPAARAGLAAGDQILTVDGRSTENITTDAAAELLAGEEGSFVQLTAAAPQQQPRELRIRRTHVDVPSVEHARLLDRDAGIGYVKISSFQKTTSRDLDAALWQLHRGGMKCLIIDIRGNPGGLLSASVEVADKFLSAGTIVSTRGRSPHEDFTYTAHRSGTWGIPLFVLVDEDSASAAEILAGAIQDHRRGSLVGRRSYGKGSVQGIFPLHSAQAEIRFGVRLTTAKFYSPSGRPISGSGVTPDLVVHEVAKPVIGARTKPADDDDADLAAAMQAARRQFAQR